MRIGRWIEGHHLAASLSHVETRQVRPDYTLRWNGQVVSDRAPGDPHWIARGQRAGRAAAGRIAGGALSAIATYPSRECAASDRPDGASPKEKPAAQASCRTAGQRLEQELRLEESAEDSGRRSRLPAPADGELLMDFLVITGGTKWREGKVRPIPGNSPHDRLVSRGISSSFKENLRRSLPRHSFAPRLQTINLGAQNAFFRHGGIYRSDVVCQRKTKPWGGTVPPPVGRPRAQVKERDGRSTPCSSSAMSSGRLFLDRVGRHQSPSPLHRHAQTNTHSPTCRAKGGHFYFAGKTDISTLP